MVMLSQEQTKKLRLSDVIPTRLCQRAWVEINLGALAHNVQQLKTFIAANQLAVVKADAYGHRL